MLRRIFSASILLAALTAPSVAAARDEATPDDESSAPEPTALPSDRLVPTPVEWKTEYESARQTLLHGEFSEAAAKFASLEKSAVNRIDRALARAQRELAEHWATRDLAFVARASLGESNLSPKALGRRTTDELVVLYTGAVEYGVGTGVWLAGMTDASNAAGVVLPMFAATAGAVGGVVALDSGKGLSYGSAQAISTGLHIGFEAGIAGAIYGNAGDKDLGGKGTATLVWGSATAGIVGGLVFGHVLETTPGRSSWVGSTALWTGLVSGVAVGAAADDEGTGAAVAGVGLGLGTAVGIATAGAVSPSIARVRFLDLGGVGGGLVGAGVYALAAGDDLDGRAMLGTIAASTALGLGATWLLTRNMAEDRPYDGKANKEATGLAGARASLGPTAGGFTIGLSGQLD